MSILKSKTIHLWLVSFGFVMNARKIMYQLLEEVFKNENEHSKQE